MIAWDITVNATAEEGIATRLITGPFMLTEVAFRSSAAGGVSQQIRIVTADLFPAPATVIGTESGLPNQLATDASRSIGTFYANSTYERHALRWINRSGTARLVFMVNNTTAGAVTIAGHVVVQHLREAQPGELSDCY